MTSTRVVRTPGATGSSFPWAPLLALSLATFVTVTCEMVPAALLPQMGASLGASQARVGLLVSAWAVTIVVSSLPLVRLTASIPRRTLLCGSLLILGAANAVTAAAPSYPVAVASRIAGATAHGLFWSIVIVYAGSIVADRHVGRAISVVLAGPTMAGIIGIPLAAAAGTSVGWRLVFWVLASLTSTAAVVLRALLPGSGGSAGPSDARTRWDASATLVIGVAVLGSFILVGHFAAFTYVSPLLTEVGGFARPAVGPLLFAFGVAGAVGLAAAGLLSDRAPRLALVLTAWLFALVLGALVLLGHDPVTSVVVVLVWGALIGLFPPVFQAQVLRAASAGFRPTAGAVVVTTFNLGIASGAWLGGLVVSGQAIDRLALLAASIVTCAALGLTALATRTRV